MELINRLELLVGSIGVVIGLFTSLFLFFKKKQFSKATIFLAIYLLVFAVRMGKSLFYGYLKLSFTFHQVFLSALLIIGPTLWFYFLQLIKKRINKVAYLIHYGAFLGLVLLSFFINFSYDAYFYLSIFFHGLSYCLYLLYHLLKNVYLKENKSLRKWLLLLVGATVIFFINAILIFFKIVPFYPTSAFIFSFVIILLFTYGLNNLVLFKVEKEKYVGSKLTKEEVHKYHQKLKKIIVEDKLYLDAELSLTKLSNLIGISSKGLSQVINQIENINYSQYITKYRIEEVKRKLKDPKYNNYKISAIAFESGFNSVSSFNSAFKKITNTTAAKYRTS